MVVLKGGITILFTFFVAAAADIQSHDKITNPKLHRRLDSIRKHEEGSFVTTIYFMS